MTPVDHHQNTSNDTPHQRRLFAMAGLLLFSITLIRLPLWLLPGPGRDEAAYHYWAHHFEPAFTPLIQIGTRLFELVLQHSLWSLRGQMIVLGFLVIWLNDKRLQTAGSSTTTRLLAAAVIGLTPWQSFAGSVLHPDNYLLAALLGFVLAAQHGRILLIAVAAWAMVLAKPTGLVLLPAAWWLIGRLESAEPWRPIMARGLLVAAFLSLALPMEITMVRGIADFGRMSGDVAPSIRFGATMMAAVFLGGPLLLGLSIIGLRQRWTILRQGATGQQRREAEASLAAAAMLLAFFMAAAVLRGQFKGNWVMPALVLLLPLGTVKIPRWALASGLAVTVVASLGQTVGLRWPQTVGRVESVLADRGLDLGSQAYSVHAGVRETAVSSSRTWQHHLAEYGDGSGFAADVRRSWASRETTGAPLAWIISDDYGLVSQLHWYLEQDDVRVVVPGDGIFHRTVTSLLETDEPGLLMVLPVSVDAGDLWDQIDIISMLPTVQHPVTGATLTPCVARLRSTRS